VPFSRAAGGFPPVDGPAAAKPAFPGCRERPARRLAIAYGQLPATGAPVAVAPTTTTINFIEERTLKSPANRLIGPVLSAALAGVMILPLAASADTAAEVRAEVINSSADVRKTLKAPGGAISSQGALEFWSSGGLLQRVPADAPEVAYEAFSLTPKHVEVITLVEGQAAVAMYYSEGSYHQKGGSPVSHYMTRVTEVYVKEDGKWKVRAAHFSPIAAGSGTDQTAVD
jgi:hypothetical protein